MWAASDHKNAQAEQSMHWTNITTIVGDIIHIVNRIKSLTVPCSSRLTLIFSSSTASSPRVVAASLDPRSRSLEFAGHLNIEADDIKLSIKCLAFELCVSSNGSGGIETSYRPDYADDDAESDSSTSDDDDSDTKQADVIVTQTKPS